MLVLILSTVILILLTKLIIDYYISMRNRPPSDFNIPFMGRLPFVVIEFNQNPLRTMCHVMAELYQKYGAVCSYKIGLQNFVIISSYPAIKEALVSMGDVFAGRPTNPFYHISAKHRGIIMSEGKLWKEHRRFALRVLKDFGFGRSTSEEMIKTEARQLIDQLIKEENTPLIFKQYSTKAVTNIIGGLVFSEQLSYDDPQFNETIHHFSVFLNTAGVLAFLVLFYPFLCKNWLMHRIPGAKDVIFSEHFIYSLVKSKIDKISSTYDSNQTPRNYIEAYLKEQHDRTNNTEFMGSNTFDNDQLLSSVFDLFAAGSDTTSSVLSWLMLFAALNPDKQEKCRAHIIDKIGNREVSWKDKNDLPYVQAFIDEGMRLSSIVPHSVDHAVIKDTEFRGYKILRDDIIFFNLYSLHRDPVYFPEPEKFKPERFLSENNQYKPSEYLIPFSMGKRVCLGEQLAKMEVFIFLLILFNVWKCRLLKKR